MPRVLEYIGKKPDLKMNKLPWMDGGPYAWAPANNFLCDVKSVDADRILKDCPRSFKEVFPTIEREPEIVNNVPIEREPEVDLENMTRSQLASYARDQFDITFGVNDTKDKRIQIIREYQAFRDNSEGAL